jgi:hypothetical protein
VLDVLRTSVASAKRVRIVETILPRDPFGTDYVYVGEYTGAHELYRLVTMLYERVRERLNLKDYRVLPSVIPPGLILELLQELRYLFYYNWSFTCNPTPTEVKLQLWPEATSPADENYVLTLIFKCESPVTELKLIIGVLREPASRKVIMDSYYSYEL